MTRIAVVVVVCGALLVGLVHGCGARVEVAKDKAMQRIDSLLGSMDVKRKEIELSVTGLKEGIDGLDEGQDQGPGVRRPDPTAGQAARGEARQHGRCPQNPSGTSGGGQASGDRREDLQPGRVE